MKFNPEVSDRILSSAYQEGRTTLLEHETYTFLASAGLQSAYPCHLVKTAQEFTQDLLDQFNEDTIILKVVSPYISHKSDVGGVITVRADLKAIHSAIDKMLDDVPKNYLSWLQSQNLPLPAQFSDLQGDSLRLAVSREIRGVLVREFIPHHVEGFGYEMLAGLQWTREFGPVITMGLGGIDTELFAASMLPGLSTISVSATETTSGEFIEQFKQTLIYRKVAGLTRGAERIAQDSEFSRCFEALSALAAYYGPSGKGEFTLSELEVNPFIFSDGQAIPVDGLCKFKKRESKNPISPVQKIHNLLHADSLAIIGVSAKKMNMGRIILRNVIKNQFPKDHLYIIRPGLDEIDEISCVDSIKALPEKVDVLVLAVDASQTPAIISEAAESGKVEAVIIIPGGLGEKSGTEEIVRKMNDAILQSRYRPDHGPVFVGGNCLGILSRPGRYDTLFVPDAKLPKNYDRKPDPVAFLSQSGARMITVMSQQSTLTPEFAISTGNQMDLGISDFLDYMRTSELQIKVFAVYVEGFRDLGGLKMIQTVRHLTRENRTVVFYKAGRTAAGKTATSGHTASVAGNYEITAQLLESAGAIVCDTFTEFNELTRLAVALHHKSVSGNRFAAISNAGYETVGMADNTGLISGLELAAYSRETKDRIHQILVDGRIDSLVDIRNPMDVTPMGNDMVHESIIQAQLDDPNVDAVIAATIPITPAQQTLPAGLFGREDIQHPDSYPNRIIRLVKSASKPVISVIDSGEVYDPMVKMMEENGVVVFRTADLALKILGRYLTNRLKRRA
jgi:acyl-CoA synthetase (NDP forming)